MWKVTLILTSVNIAGGTALKWFVHLFMKREYIDQAFVGELK